MGYSGQPHSPFTAPAANANGHRPPGRHVAGVLRKIADAVGKGDEPAYVRLKKELGEFGWRLVSKKDHESEGYLR